MKRLQAVTFNCGCLALLFEIFTIFHALVNTANVSALSLSVSSINLSLDLLPGKSGSTSITTSITAPDANGGYTLTLTGPTTGSTLTGTRGGTLSPVSSTNWTAESGFGNNQWGIKYCNLTANSNCLTSTNYQPAPGTNTLTIDQTSTNNTTPVNYALAVGIKISETATVDNYSGTFTLAATSNATNYSIGYVDPLSNWPTTTAGSTTNTTVTLSDKTPTKPGYTFKGWCSKPTTNSTCSGTTYQPNTSYNIDGTPITNLYAIWEKAVEEKEVDNIVRTMQNISTWRNDLKEGETAYAMDNRDSRIYKVGKLKDGKIWMLDNLAFNGTNASGTYIQMNSTNTNITGTRTWSSSVNWTTQSSNTVRYTTPLINVGYLTTVPSDTISTNGGYKVGAYYNYCAATVQTMCEDKYNTATNATQDICPAGWRMPTGGASGEYQALYSNSNYNSCDKIRAALHLPLVGYYNGYSVFSQGSNGYFWSSTYDNSANMYHLGLGTTNVYPQDSNNRGNGDSVRCVTAGSGPTLGS